jgi:2-hydroxyglutarate dehydrogenase
MVYDIAVVGGGIVGLATTRELLLRHPRLRIANVEKENAWNKHQTGHNSGVIHSGIYYKPGSLKAKLCVEGRKLAWEYCDAKGIEYKQVGKLIVATEESELGRLDDLWARGQANGIEGLEMLDAAQIAEREPYCRGLRAIFSPVTGIVDWGRVATAYGDDAREMGADSYLSHQVTGIERRGNVTVLRTPKGEIQASAVITCGGLYSDVLAKMTDGATDPKIVPFRGDYLILKPDKSYLVNGNIYPVPDPEFPFLGVHFTPRMDGSIWLGPERRARVCARRLLVLRGQPGRAVGLAHLSRLLQAGDEVLEDGRGRDVPRPRAHRVRLRAAALYPRAEAGGLSPRSVRRARAGDGCRRRAGRRFRL